MTSGVFARDVLHKPEALIPNQSYKGTSLPDPHSKTQNGVYSMRHGKQHRMTDFSSTVYILTSNGSRSKARSTTDAVVYVIPSI